MSYRSRYRMDHVDNERVGILATDFLHLFGLSETECRTRSDFQDILNDKRHDMNWKRKPDSDILEQICERAERFETMIPQIQIRLRSCYEDHLSKSFLSYSSELDGLELRAVIEYDKKIKEYKSKIEDDLEQLDNFFSEYENMKEPYVLKYLEFGGKVAASIEQCLLLIVDICEVTKKWSNQDKAYPKKLWDETISVNVQRGRVMEDIKKLQRKKSDLRHTLGRKETQRDKSIQKLEETKRERSMMEARAEESRRVLVEMEEKYKKTFEELKLTERKITNRKINSPKYFETLWASVEHLKVVLSNLEDMKDGQVRQVSRSVKSVQDLTSTVEQLDRETAAQISQVCNRCHHRNVGVPVHIAHSRNSKISVLHSGFSR